MEFVPRPACRVAQAQGLGVKLQPIRPARIAIEPVTENRMPDAQQMHPQLMRAPGQRRERQTGRIGFPSDHLPSRYRVAALLVAHHLKRTVRPVAAQRQIDRPAILRHHPRDPRHIAFFRHPLLELQPHMAMRLAVQGQHDHARRVHIQPVNDRRPRIRFHRPRGEAIGQIRRPPRHRQQAGRLVQHQQIIIGMQNIEPGFQRRGVVKGRGLGQNGLSRQVNICERPPVQIGEAAMTYILAIDQGTTSTRAIVFDGDMRIVSVGQAEFAQHFPRSGWVEHEAEDLLSTTVSTCREALEKAGLSASDIAAIGITNQRETTVVWDRATGKAIHRAIVWQDRRTADVCAALRDAGHEADISRRTGLLADPYFSGTKAAWILDTVDGARARAENGELLFGTVDTWLIWHLTGGAVFATDATNASRTMLYNIAEGCWDETMCDLLRVPMAMLPDVRDSAADFGMAQASFFGGEIPIRGVAGDQQAAVVGQACFTPGMMKSTYGTGCFALLNTGDVPVASKNRLLTTIAYQLDGKPSYALEGSIFIAGAVVQWLRDGLGIIEDAAETHALAERADPAQTLYLVPAFTGLGAPYWDAEARGAIYGLTRNSGPAEFARAALQSVGYQTRDLLEAMRGDWAEDGETVLRVDGGMTSSAWTMQFLADLLCAPVDRPRVLETTALGAAWLAGMKAGVYPDRDAFAASWARDVRFTPQMDSGEADVLYAGWQDAVSRTLSKPRA